MKEFPKPVFDDALDEKQRIEWEKEQRREALRLAVREHFPQVTAWADEWREHFPGTTLLWAAEKQYVIGKVPKDVQQQHEQAFGPLVDVSKEK